MTQKFSSKKFLDAGRKDGNLKDPFNNISHVQLLLLSHFRDAVGMLTWKCLLKLFYHSLFSWFDFERLTVVAFSFIFLPFYPFQTHSHDCSWCISKNAVFVLLFHQHKTSFPQTHLNMVKSVKPQSPFLFSFVFQHM